MEKKEDTTTSLKYSLSKYAESLTIACGGVGGIAAIITDLSFYPVDTIKTRIQASGWKTRIIDKIRTPSHYSGASCVVAAAFPVNLAFFAIYEFLNSTISKYAKKHNGWVQNRTYTYMIAAGIADVVAMSIKNPFEVIKQNRQFAEFSNTRKAIATVWNKRGFKGFYAGYSALLWREIPCSVIEMGIYECLLRKYV